MNMEKPILFSTEMVRAILDSRKTQTRRRVKARSYITDVVDGVAYEETEDGDQPIRCPYGQPGDVLWVRETWDFGYPYVYKADGGLPVCKWRPSIHMPRRAARLFLRVVSVRCERLHEISEEDAIAEGIEDFYAGLGLSEDAHAWRKYDVTKAEVMQPGGHWECVADSGIDSFASLWRSINGPDSWNTNPWVWVVEFEKIQP